MKRDRIEGKVDTITSGFLQLPNHVGVIVLRQKKGRERSAGSEKLGRDQSTNIKDNIRTESLDKVEVVRRRDGGYLVT